MLFISHRTADKKLADEVKKRAMAQGYTAEQVFLDSDPDSGIKPGDKWQEKLYESLHKSRAMIVLCSQPWLASRWCFVELGFARATAMTIFPILIEECDIDSTLNPDQALDISALTSEAERDDAFCRLWESLRDRQLGPKDIRPWPPAGQKDDCPYPGLAAFTEQFAPVYFGREMERDLVIRELTKMRDQGIPRFLIITGGSGSGKSSLLRAGLWPWLNHDTENQRWLPLRILRFNESREQHTLLSQLAEELAAHFPDTSRPDWKTLRAILDSDDAEKAALAFADEIRNLNIVCQCTHRSIVLLIDQFEELLSATDRPSGGRFLKFLHALLTGSDRSVLAVGTMRSDYLGVLERHKAHVERPYFQPLSLSPFPWSRVTDLIVKPASRVGVTFETELVKELAGDAPRNDPLPLLAFTLESLYRKHKADKVITVAHYNDLGRMDGAIRHAVSKALPAKLTTAEEQALRTCFVQHLVQLNEHDLIVRRPALWLQLHTACPLLKGFVDARLLHTSGDGPATVVEVSHDALFRCWEQLQSWLNTEMNSLRLRRKLAVTAREWARSILPVNPDGDIDLLFSAGQLAAVDEWQGIAIDDNESRFLRVSRERRRTDAEREIARLEQLARAEEARTAAERSARLAQEQELAQARALGAEQRSRVESTLALALAVQVQQGVGTRQQRLHLARRACILDGRSGTYFQSQIDAAFRSVLTLPNLVAVLPGHKSTVSALVYSHDGRWLASGSRNGVRIWSTELDAYSVIHRGGPGVARVIDESIAGVQSLAFSRDGHWLAILGDDGTVYLAALDCHDAPPLIVGRRGVGKRADYPKRFPIGFSDDGSRVAFFGADGAVQVWGIAPGLAPERIADDLTTGELLFLSNGVFLRPDAPRFDPPLQPYDTSATLAATRTVISLSTSFYGNPPVFFPTSFSPDGKYFAVSHFWRGTGGVNLWDLHRPDEKYPTTVVSRPSNPLTFSGNSRRLAGSNWIYDIGAPCDEVHHVHECGSPTAIALSPDGNILACGQGDGTVRVIHFNRSDATYRETSFNKAIRDLAWEPDGRTLAVVTSESEIPCRNRIWRDGDSSCVDGGDLHAPEVAALQNRDVGRWRVRDDAYFRWVRAGRPKGRADEFWMQAEKEFHRVNSQIRVFVVPSGRIVQFRKTLGNQVAAFVWDQPSEVPRATVYYAPSGIPPEEALAFGVRGDGELLLASADQNVLNIWDLRDAAKPLKVLRRAAPDLSTFSIAVFSGDGRFVAAGRDDDFGDRAVSERDLAQLMYVWDLDGDAHSPRRVLRASAKPLAMAFDRDCQMLALGCAHGTVAVCDLGESPARAVELDGVILSRPVLLQGHQGEVRTVAFSADGALLASGGEDKSVRLWNMALPETIPILLNGHDAAISTVAFSADGKFIASGDENGIVRVWIAQTGDLASVVEERIWENMTADEWKHFAGEKVPLEI